MSKDCVAKVIEDAKTNGFRLSPKAGLTTQVTRPKKRVKNLALGTSHSKNATLPLRNHNFRLIQSVAPVDKSKSGICVDWATKVANANSSFALTTTPATSHSSTGGLGAFAHGSSTTTQSGLPQGAYQKGLDDEVEVLHYQASLPSPGSVMLKQGLLKRDPDTNTAFPMEQLTAKKPRTGRRSLPPGAEENNQFCAVFIPTYKCSFRSVADVMIKQFFKCKDYHELFKDYNTHQVWAEDMLADCKFIWEKVDKRSGLMHAPFILQVFAMQLNSTTGAEEVPALRATGVNKVPAQGSIGPCCCRYKSSHNMTKHANDSKVERTLKLWADREMEVLDAADPVREQANKLSIKAASKLNPLTRIVSNAASKFSAENWAVKMNNYFKSINKMKLDSLKEVMQLAMPFMSPSKTCHQGCSYGPQSLVKDDEDILMMAAASAGTSLTKPQAMCIATNSGNTAHFTNTACQLQAAHATNVATPT
ncbi:hypothetical protein EDB83DRAFT_2323441 [Lactarius deliciosus]|nr:hypothetical protein EDB83DRAFT_2323441 [Lactarius deliciosus]